jgi:molecular chaperone DnaJ
LRFHDLVTIAEEPAKKIASPCSDCSGTGKKKKRSQISVKVPAGIDTDQRLKLTNEGDAGERGGPPGDLYVIINVLPHEFFQRDEADVLCEIPVTFTQAALGCEIEVPTLEGRVKVKVPEGTQSQRILKLKGKGMPYLGSPSKGDQLLKITVETPTGLNKEQKELLRKFEEISKDAHPNHRGFFDRVKDLFD